MHVLNWMGQRHARDQESAGHPLAFGSHTILAVLATDLSLKEAGHLRCHLPNYSAAMCAMRLGAAG